MKIPTQSQMQNIDSATISQGTPAEQLMFRAGTVICETIIQDIKIHKKSKIAIIIGPGNNGGDGIVTAGLLKKKGYKKIKLFFTKNPNDLTGSSFYYYKKYKNIQNRLISESALLKKYVLELKESDVIIDALFGTGVSRAIEGIYGELIESLRDFTGKIISIDLPSGLYTNSSVLPKRAIQADYTITIGLPKISLLLYPSKNYVGKLFIRNIGFSEDLLKDETILWNFYTQDDALLDKPKRFEDSFKNFYGHLPIWAGSIGKTGAAVLSSSAALKAGAGLVSLFCEDSLNTIFETKLTEVMTLPISYTDKITSLKIMEKFCKDKPVFLIGPGLGTTQPVSILLQKILSFYKSILILDADGINLLSNNLSILKDFEGQLILTPHLGEMSRLIDKPIKKITPEIFPEIQAFSKQYKAYVVLKASNTILFTPENEQIYINSTGNSALAKAGSGDVLSGIIASVVLQNKEQSLRLNQPFSLSRSILFGIWLHGKAGEIQSEKMNKRSVCATDIISSISDGYNFLEKEYKDV